MPTPRGRKKIQRVKPWRAHACSVPWGGVHQQVSEEGLASAAREKGGGAAILGGGKAAESGNIVQASAATSARGGLHVFFRGRTRGPGAACVVVRRMSELQKEKFVFHGKPFKDGG